LRLNRLFIPVVRVFRKLGPGLITGASDDDPSGIATYSQAGAQFGLTTLWTAWISFPLMAAIQGMCARIGIVTQEGLTGVLKKNYPRAILYLMILFSFPAIVMNIGADIAGMGAVANLICPAIPVWIFSILFTGLVMAAIILLPYRKMARTMKYLAMILLVYLIVPFIAHTNWLKVANATLLPHVIWNKDYLNILVAILGTTISPYLFFWQANMEVEEMQERQLVSKISRKIVVNNHILGVMKTDVNLGMLFSNIVMFFIILTTGTVLFQGGVKDIQTVEQAARALQPLAGNFAYYLFAIGVIGTGFLAIPVLCGSLSYMFSETFGWKMGMNKKFHEAPSFYIIIIISLVLGLLMNYVGLSPIKALIYTAILYGLTAPIIIAIILHICNNKRVMGEHTNGRVSNFLGFTTLVLMTIAAVVLIYLQWQ